MEGVGLRVWTSSVDLCASAWRPKLRAKNHTKYARFRGGKNTTALSMADPNATSPQCPLTVPHCYALTVQGSTLTTLFSKREQVRARTTVLFSPFAGATTSANVGGDQPTAMANKKRKDRRNKSVPRKSRTAEVAGALVDAHARTHAAVDAHIRTSKKRKLGRSRGNVQVEASKMSNTSGDADGENAGGIYDSALCFQTLMASHRTQETQAEAEQDVSSIFFDLANAPLIQYRISESNVTSDRNRDVTSLTTQRITIEQDLEGACGEHTGGIVWETSYLLCEYFFLQQQQQQHATSKSDTMLGDVCEVGAGCGLAGQVLHRSGLAHRVVMTECHPVLRNLQSNLKRNRDDEMSKASRRNPSKQAMYSLACIDAVALDWTKYEEDAKAAHPLLRPAAFDTIIGTDVIFAQSLVEPLLRTMAYLSHPATQAYLCLQERCPDSYRLLFEKSKEHGWDVADVSDRVYEEHSALRWGKELDCRLLHFTRLKE